MAFHTAIPINSLYNPLNLLQGNTRNLNTMFSKVDIAREKASYPASLKPLKGALVIHELQVSSGGQILAKKLPSDTSSFRVDLGASFATGLASESPASRLQQPLVRVLPRVQE